MKVRDITEISIMVALLAVSTFIRIPVPVIGYFTLQLTVVIFSGLLLGSKRGAIVCLIYIVGGLVGIPWFAAGGGLAYIFQPTFGFILSFPLAAFLSGKIDFNGSKITNTIKVMFATLSVWVLGMLFIAVLYTSNVAEFMLGLFTLSLIADIVLSIVALNASERIYKADVLSKNKDN